MSIYEIFTIFQRLLISAIFKKNQNSPLVAQLQYMFFNLCEREMETKERLRRYKPYKLMNIASPHKKFYIFQRFLFFFQFSRKIKLNLPLHSSNICSFHVRERNGIRGGVTEIQAVQAHEYCKSI